MLTLLTTLFALGAAAMPHVQKRSVSGTAVVNFNNNTGTPGHLASGLLYGIPDTKGQIPDHFYTDIGFNYGRAGGSQLGVGGRGWIWGAAEYKVRMNSALSNYNTARKYNNASFFLILSDLWGADGTENSTAPFPGDNGNWTYYDQFLTQVFADIKAASATPGLVIDIWNEPDESAFWTKGTATWLQLWGHTWHRVKNELGIPTSGPCLNESPSTSSSWWTEWLSFIASNASIPDEYTWHMESGNGDMQSLVTVLNSLLSTNNLPSRQININEYATYSEQIPCGGIWFISQLERVNAKGLRGNWLSSNALHDFFAGLLGKPNAGTSSYSATATGYWPAAEFQVYKYYATNMTGYRVSTSPTSDTNGEVYAVVGSNKVRLLVGARATEGTWAIQLNSLTSLGLPSSGTLNILTYQFNGSTSNHFQEYDGLWNKGVVPHPYSNGTVTFPIWSTDDASGWAFEFNI